MITILLPQAAAPGSLGGGESPWDAGGCVRCPGSACSRRQELYWYCFSQRTVTLMEKEVAPLSSTGTLLFLSKHIFFPIVLQNFVRHFGSAAVRWRYVPHMDLVAAFRICFEAVYLSSSRGSTTELHRLMPNICVRSLWKLMVDKPESIYSGKGELPSGKAPLF